MPVCLAPKGLEEGSTVELARDFRLSINRPVSFKLYSSTTRADPAGSLLTLLPADPGGVVEPGTATVASAAGTADDSADLIELPPIVTALRAPGRSEVVVRLKVRVTELGALEILVRAAEPARVGCPDRIRGPGLGNRGLASLLRHARRGDQGRPGG